jgi:hypothetical protein
MRWIAVLAIDLALLAPLARGRGGRVTLISGAVLVVYLNVLVGFYLGAMRQARTYRANGGRIGAGLGGCLVLVSILVGLMVATFVALVSGMASWAL